jgi:UDP-N-acetylmuramyl pentapeptide phosphotransferase/UDP-N-acetylglucosamine-1-phosphate transferase
MHNHMMQLIFIAFVISSIATLLVIRFAPFWMSRAEDHDFSGPQKFHCRAVPRIGGIPIVLGLTAAIALCAPVLKSHFDLQIQPFLCLLLAAVPTFGAGLIEDLTKTQTPRRRLFYACVSALLGIYLSEVLITRTDLPIFDFIVAAHIGAILLTVFVVTGVINAINIIDGFNGLASMCSILMLGAIAIVGHEVGDVFITSFALISMGAILGFFVWNFPAGLIFLGDGGAYFLGFLIAELGISLAHRNPEVSPIFPLMVCIYPVFEVLFSMYRRAVLKRGAVGAPDGVHLHSLIFRRLVRWGTGSKTVTARTKRNSLTAPYLWVLCSFTLAPAVLWWDSTPILGFYILAFAFAYIGLYWRIVRFRSPAWLVLNKRKRTAPSSSS